VTQRSTGPAWWATAVVVSTTFIAGCATTSTPNSAPTEPPVTTSDRAPTSAPQRAKAKASADGYLDPTDASVGTTLEFLGQGRFVMLNLFRLREVPDFTKHPELEPPTPMSTRDLFYRYIEHMDAYLEKVGAKRVLLADGGPMLIGPAGEHWDVVQMVEYPSTQAFVELGLLVRDEVADREVMLADSRIMSMRDVPLDAVVTPGR
jgi:hypothetical protein